MRFSSGLHRACRKSAVPLIIQKKIKKINSFQNYLKISIVKDRKVSHTNKVSQVTWG
jgi:hypothetical protein